jgi:hypothetical protein
MATQSNQEANVAQLQVMPGSCAHRMLPLRLAGLLPASRLAPHNEAQAPVLASFKHAVHLRVCNLCHLYLV